MAKNAIHDPKCAETAEKMLSNENQPTVTTFSVKLVKDSKKQMHVMEFHAAQQVKFSDWKRARLQRENNSTLYSHHINDEPKFGGGSAYGRAAREEARNRRMIRKYKPNNQPWILSSTVDKQPDKDKTFKGVRVGGVGEYSNYYIFVQNADGNSISAYPIQDWYKFRATQRYRTLNAEEAEEEYMRRHKTLNYFSLMMQKRLRGEEEKENKDAKLQANAMTKPIKDLKVSETDDWISSDEDDDFDANNNQSDNDENKKKKKKAKLKKKNEPDNEAFEESDDGDEEGRECEYITDSSASESELEQQKEEGSKSVAEETGLKSLLSSSDSESHEDEVEVRKERHRGYKEKPACGADKNVDLQDTKKENKSAGSNLLSATKDKIDGKDEAKSQKRTMSVSSDEMETKRFKKTFVFSTSYVSEASESEITIEAISKYLKRKPMTLVDLLKKFKKKNKGLKTKEIGRILLPTLEKIKLSKKEINGVIYYSL